MKPLPVFYSVLGLLALATGVGGAIQVYRGGSAAVPGWRDLVRPGEMSASHAFLQGECESCHTPLRGVEASGCVLCHATETTILAQQSTSFHAQVRECRSCHVEHQGRAVRPTRMDHDVLVRIGAAADAPTPPASLWKQLIASVLPSLHGDPAPSAARSLDCASCHSNRDPHRELFGRNCADCHGTRAWRITDYRHPSPDSRDCAQCHQAPPSHYMMHFQMVSVRVAGQAHARVEQCYLCHQTDAWNNIKGVGWYKHH